MCELCSHSPRRGEGAPNALRGYLFHRRKLAENEMAHCRGPREGTIVPRAETFPGTAGAAPAREPSRAGRSASSH